MLAVDVSWMQCAHTPPTLLKTAQQRACNTCPWFLHGPFVLLFSLRHTQRHSSPLSRTWTGNPNSTAQQHNEWRGNDACVSILQQKHPASACDPEPTQHPTGHPCAHMCTPLALKPVICVWWAENGVAGILSQLTAHCVQQQSTVKTAQRPPAGVGTWGADCSLNAGPPG